MQFEPPTKPTDVSVSMGDSSDSAAGTDQNGIVTGRWKTGIFGFTDSLVPNGTPFIHPLISLSDPLQQQQYLTVQLLFLSFFLNSLGVMSCCCTGVVVAQVASRIGLMKFNHVVGAFVGLYLVAFIAAVSDSGFFEVLTWLGALAALLCCARLRWRIRTLFSIPGSPLEDVALSACCGCCSVAQMASHVESYEPGVFAFAPRATLEGYSAT